MTAPTMEEVADKTPEEVEEICLEAGIGVEREGLEGIFVANVFWSFLLHRGWRSRSGCDGGFWRLVSPTGEETEITVKRPVPILIGYAWYNSISIEEAVDEFTSWLAGKK